MDETTKHLTHRAVIYLRVSTTEQAETDQGVVPSRVGGPQHGRHARQIERGRVEVIGERLGVERVVAPLRGGELCHPALRRDQDGAVGGPGGRDREPGDQPATSTLLWDLSV